MDTPKYFSIKKEHFKWLYSTVFSQQSTGLSSSNSRWRRPQRQRNTNNFCAHAQSVRRLKWRATLASYLYSAADRVLERFFSQLSKRTEIVSLDEPSAADNEPSSTEKDVYFVERPSQDFFCPVSLGLLLEPQLTSCCGHHLSLEVATRLQRERKPCPMCNDDGWNAMLDKYHRRKVHEVRVRCWHLNDGCEYEWVGQVNELKRHAESCEKRPWECRYCALKCTYIKGEKNHWPTCPKFPEPCPNACEVGSVERCNMEQHLGVCPLEPVACEMKEFGCSVVVPRKELATHMRENELQHLTAMTRLNLSLTRQLQQEITDLKVRIDKHEQTQTERMLTKLEELQQISEHIWKHTAPQCTGCSVLTFSESAKEKPLVIFHAVLHSTLTTMAMPFSW